MKIMLEHILDKSPNGQASVILQFVDTNGGMSGELSRFELDGFYELRAVMGTGLPNDPRPKLVSHFFMADSVSRVMVIHPDNALPQIVPPPGNGGLIIPT